MLSGIQLPCRYRPINSRQYDVVAEAKEIIQ